MISGSSVMGRPRIRARVGTHLHRVAQPRGEARAQLFQRVDTPLLTIDGCIQDFQRVFLESEARLEIGNACRIVHSQFSLGRVPASINTSGIKVHGRRRRTSSS